MTMRRRALHRLCQVTVVLLAATTASHATDRQDFASIDRGRYLAITADCTACHTAPGGKLFAGGVPLKTPFGVIVSSNITPDPEDGIGRMTDEAFYATMHEGIGRGGAHLYPAMPYPAYTIMTRRDVQDIRNYLNTVEPVKVAVHSDTLPFPFNIRAVMIAWNMLNFRPTEYKPDTTKSAEWNRGAYLVQGAGHCGSCHTPKNLMGADKTAVALQGTSLQGWFAPNITGDERSGIGSWSIDDIVSFLKTGANARTVASGPMAEEIVNSSSRMTDADLRAIAVYLKDLRPTLPVATPIATQDPVMQAGQSIYTDRCAGCHHQDGSGAARIFPDLTHSPSVEAGDPQTLIRLVLFGNRGAATDAAPTAPAMPPFGWSLDDGQVASVLTFIRNSWGNASPVVNAGEVGSLRTSEPGQ
jgi:mono/diheme cytochrome c family protein